MTPTDISASDPITPCMEAFARCRKVLEEAPRTQATHPTQPNPSRRAPNRGFLPSCRYRSARSASFSEVFGHRSRGARSPPMGSVSRSFSRDEFTFPNPRTMFYRFYDRYRIFNDRRFRPFPFAFYCESLLERTKGRFSTCLPSSEGRAGQQRIRENKRRITVYSQGRTSACRCSRFWTWTRASARTARSTGRRGTRR